MIGLGFHASPLDRLSPFIKNAILFLVPENNNNNKQTANNLMHQSYVALRTAKTSFVKVPKNALRRNSNT